MKLKQQIVICRPDEFLKGNYDGCFRLYTPDCDFIPEDWIRCGEVEFELKVDSDEVVNVVTTAIEAEIVSMKREHFGKLGILERRLAELKALPAPEENPDQDSESYEDIARAENAAIDGQEDREI